jgi:hypothetical protein
MAKCPPEGGTPNPSAVAASLCPRTPNISSIPALHFSPSFLLLLYAEMSDVRKAG